MRHFRIQDEPSQMESQSKISFNQSLAKTLQSTLKLLPFAQFTVNYGYAIQNVWVTMLMIVDKTPAWLDSFIWITPIVIAVLLRPYIVRFIHQINLKVYRQINITCIALLLGALGCFITGYSCDVDKRAKDSIFSRTFLRILICTIGWTMMDVGFEFSLFFAEKIKQSHEELLQQSSKQKQQKEQHKGLFTQQNFAFYGLLVGYTVSILICWIVHGKSIKAFYRCAKYAYYSVGILAAVTGMRLYVEGKLNLPHRSDQALSQNVANGELFAIQRKMDFYLPGWTELVNSNAYTFSLLLVHGVVVFLNDIILIYTTMWFSDLHDGTWYSTQGEAYIYGLEMGSLTLLGYTVIDNLHVRGIFFSNPYFLKLAFFVTTIAFAFADYQYGHVGFILLAISVSILNHFYRRTVLARETQENPLFQRCIETTQRIQKIIVLSVFPAIVLLVLKRDDIPDSLIVSSVLSLVAIVAFLVSRMNVRAKGQEIKGVKVDKIQ